MLGLRVSEAFATDITDLRYEAGYELLHVLGKGAKPADIPLPIQVLRAVREAVDGRTAGAILRTRTGRRMDRAGASRALTSLTSPAGAVAGFSRAFVAAAIVAVPLAVVAFVKMPSTHVTGPGGNLHMH
jgi:integrase